MQLPKCLRLAFVAALAAGIVCPSAEGQSGYAFPRRTFETRAEIEERVRTAETASNKNEADRLRFRLAHGDFNAGDRIFVTFQQGAAMLSDTMTVQSAKRLILPQMGEFNLDGVLRSELADKLRAHLANYLKDPVVKAVPLVRLGLVGQVNRPGYYYTTTDIPLNDVLMQAGGPTHNADLGKVKVRRVGGVMFDEASTAIAFRDGMSVDNLSMQSGDEIEIGQRRRTNWGMIIPLATSAVSIGLALVLRN